MMLVDVVLVLLVNPGALLNSSAFRFLLAVLVTTLAVIALDSSQELLGALPLMLARSFQLNARTITTTVETVSAQLLDSLGVLLQEPVLISLTAVLLITIAVLA